MGLCAEDVVAKVVLLGGGLSMCLGATTADLESERRRATTPAEPGSLPGWNEALYSSA